MIIVIFNALPFSTCVIYLYTHILNPYMYNDFVLRKLSINQIYICYLQDQIDTAFNNIRFCI